MKAKFPVGSLLVFFSSLLFTVAVLCVSAMGRKCNYSSFKSNFNLTPSDFDEHHSFCSHSGPRWMKWMNEENSNFVIMTLIATTTTRKSKTHCQPTTNTDRSNSSRFLAFAFRLYSEHHAVFFGWTTAPGQFLFLFFFVFLAEKEEIGPIHHFFFHINKVSSSRRHRWLGCFFIVRP